MPCGSCDECCRLLAIEEISKPWNTACPHSRPGRSSGCCTIYENRPASCAAFRCLYLASQSRHPGEQLDPSLRPDKTHVVFYRSGLESDPRVIFAHVDPAYPQAWHAEPVNGEIQRLIARGALVVVVVNDQRIVLQKDATLQFASEADIRSMRGAPPPLKPRLLAGTKH